MREALEELRRIDSNAKGNDRPMIEGYLSQSVVIYNDPRKVSIADRP